MYLPTPFSQADVIELSKLIRDYPFASLVVNTKDGLDANHLPFLLRDDGSEFGVLAGHIARSNPVWKSFSAKDDVLVIFQGAHAYISPSWYSTKQEHGKVVPTWNYNVVHASGKMRVIEDGKWLHELINELTNVHEAKFENPWSVDDAPADFIEKLSGAIIGIEIPIDKLIGKLKVSQNQPEQNRQGVSVALASSDSELERKMSELVQSTI